MTEKKQGKLDDFFFISKDKDRSNSSKADKEFYDNQQNRENLNKSSEVNYYKYENKSSIQLENCYTYALPIHIPKIWNYCKPKLEDMKSGKIIEISEFIGIVQNFIQIHYRNQLKNNNLSLLEGLIESLTSQDRDFFFQKLLPFLADLVLETEKLFPSPIKILKQNVHSSLKLSKKQLSCLIAHMFFCTLHKQNNSNLRLDCNFSNLYKGSQKSNIKLEKLKCIYNYLRRIYKDHLQNIQNDRQFIIFERLVYKSKIHGDIDVRFWESNKTQMKDCIIKDTGKLEGEDDSIQVDFANRMIGGGVLDGGCVQEEIRFLVSPETFGSLLFAESLLDHEALMIIGTEKYNKYDGYSDTFVFAGNVRDTTQIDHSNVRKSMILAIDATDFSKVSNSKIQFKIERLLREINKAYIGFKGGSKEEGNYKIATGRWGCGVFLGDSQLKFILQWIAASVAGRDMIFYRFEDQNLNDIEKIVKKFKNATVGEVFDNLKSYNTLVFSNKQDMPLFEALLYVL